MNIPTSLRDRRNIFGPPHYSIAHYCTDTRNDMKNLFGEDYFLNNLHLIPDSMKKNLADTIITEDKMPPKNEFISNFDVKTNDKSQDQTDYSPLSGITSFLSGVVNVISNVMFSKRKHTDFSSEKSQEMALPRVWHGAKSDDENKILQDEKFPIVVSNAIAVAEMGDCRSAAAHCQNKLDQVRLLLSKPVPCTNRVRRRPRKVFVEPSSVEDCFEDAFAPEDFETISNESYQEYVSPSFYHDHIFNEIAAPKIKTENNILETTDVVKSVPDSVLNDENTQPVLAEKCDLVSSCEDKLSKLKALLQERRKKVIEPESEVQVLKLPERRPKKQCNIKDKRYKNINRCTDKRRESRMRHNIQQDALFADELQTDDLSSIENSPSARTVEDCIPKTKNLEYFDEISGRFCSTAVLDNEDSFQIVFTDSPRTRRSSDCDSEDSFIIFEDSPDSCYVSNDCYTTNDVFGDTSESDSCDSDSEFSDSGCGNLTFKLSHSLSKSVSNLTDDSLYINNSEDEVDCTRVDLDVCEKVNEELCNTGLLIDSRKKQLRKSLPPKKVHFSTQPPKVHQMRVWAFAARQARAGHWERYALDRERFKRRIANVDVAVSWVLKPQHRSRVMFQRFMPWWNAQKKKELAEKKREEELRREADKVRELENDQVEQFNKELTENIGEQSSAEVGINKESVVDASQPSPCLRQEEPATNMNKEELTKQQQDDFIPESKHDSLKNVCVAELLKDDKNLNVQTSNSRDKLDDEADNKQVNTSGKNNSVDLDTIEEAIIDKSFVNNDSMTQKENKLRDVIQQPNISTATESNTVITQDPLYKNMDRLTKQEPVKMEELNIDININVNGNKITSAIHDNDTKRASLENMQEMHKNCLKLEPEMNEVLNKTNCKDRFTQDTVKSNTESNFFNVDDKILEVDKFGPNDCVNSKRESKNSNLSQNNEIIPYNDKILEYNNDFTAHTVKNT